MNQVFFAEEVKSKKQYAIKAVEKKSILEGKEYIYLECDILSCSG